MVDHRICGLTANEMVDGDRAWTDPSHVAGIKSRHHLRVKNIRNGLNPVDPESAELYQFNADAYIAQLKDLDKWIVEQVNTILPNVVCW